MILKFAAKTFHGFPLTPVSHKPIAILGFSRCLSVRSSTACPDLPRTLTPLFLRSSSYPTSLADFYRWHHWAIGLANSVGSSFVSLDGGPDSILLRRELNWLVEDALGHEFLHIRSSLQCGDDFQDPENGGGKGVLLRASLEELYELWRQRIEVRRPLQYIVGCEHWRDLVLSVQEGVLIPRPETAQIVDFVADLVAGDQGFRDGLWADVGTGSGAIAIGVARILGSRGGVIASDLSPVAVAVSSYNVQRYALQECISIRQGSWFEPLKDVKGKLAGIVSNPPYIPTHQILRLQAEVGRHEPLIALDGGQGGMDALIHLCDHLTLMLRPGGFFAFETNGDKQCLFLADYVETSPGFHGINVSPDFAGVQRFITGFRV